MGVRALRDGMHGVLSAAGDDKVVDGARVRPIKIGLVGNKSDRSMDREVTVKEGIELAESLGCSFVETSAKAGYNIDKAFHDLVRAVDATDKEAKDDQEPVAIGGFRGRLGRLARSLRLKKN